MSGSSKEDPEVKRKFGGDVWGGTGEWGGVGETHAYEHMFMRKGTFAFRSSQQIPDLPKR